ncbi:MAG: hypothetical protein ACLURX_02165 [Clostridia bacterium]
MIRKIGRFPYDISKFEKEAEKLFHDEDIIVGAMDGVNEELIQNFLEDVLKYEIAERNSKDYS